MRSRVSHSVLIVVAFSVVAFIATTASAQSVPANHSGQASVRAEYDQPARKMLRIAAGMAAAGDVQGARSVAKTVQRMPTSWQGEDYSPKDIIDFAPQPGRQHQAPQPGYPTLTNSNMQPVNPPSVTFPAPRTEKRVKVCGYCGDNRNIAPIWIEADYYYWKVRNPDVAPLVTTSTLGTPEDEAGVLGLGSTSTLLGNQSLLDNQSSGVRYGIGWQLQPHFSVMASWTNVFRDTNSRFFDLGDGILARPFENVDLGADSELINYPGLVDGTLSVNADRDFNTYELLFERSMGFWKNGFIKGQLGYRHARLDDDFSVSEHSIATGGATDGTTTHLIDEFDTNNRLHAATFGLNMHWHPTDRWVIQLGGKISAGNSRRTIRINGRTTTTDAAGIVTTTSGGLLTQGTNIRNFGDNEMTLFSEIGVKARYQMGAGTHFVLGYTFLHWDAVARATDQIDTTINTSQISPGTLTGDARPRFNLVRNDFMAHGFRAGIEYKY